MRAFLAVVVVAGTGCSQRLTPELVRQLIEKPAGTVSKDSMARVTRDLFQAEKATSMESLADLIKTNQASTSNAVPGVAAGTLEDVGDVFCVGGLVASIATFDGCKEGKDCHAELVIDSCVLRIGNAGPDEDARGKIKFKLDNTTGSTQDTTDLALEFDNWESTRGDANLDAINGQLALETVQKHDDTHTELVFASDVDANVKKKNPPFLDDGVTEHDHVQAGVRFVADQSNTAAAGSLEVLAFADEDGGQQQSVVIRLSANSHEVDATGATGAATTADAALEVVGENGTFKCTWSSTNESGAHDSVTVTSAGQCVDETGATFDFSGEASSS